MQYVEYLPCKEGVVFYVVKVGEYGNMVGRVPCKEGVVFYVVRVGEYGRKLHVGSGHLLPTVTTVSAIIKGTPTAA